MRLKAPSAWMALATLVVVGGCTPQEKVVRYKPFFAGLEGVETQSPAVAERRRTLLADPVAEGEPLLQDPGAEWPDGDPLVATNDDGSITLLMRSGLQLMHHITQTLEHERDDLFADQVISKKTRSDFLDRGLDPTQAFWTVKEHERDVALLFNRMPMGEHSPSVLMHKIGKNTFRVRTTGQASRGLEKWTGFDMVLEDGHWRLRWFIGPGDR